MKIKIAISAAVFGVLGLSAQQTVTRPAITPAPAPPAAQAPAAAAASTGPAASSPVVDSKTYVIGPEDMIQVTVWKEPSISGSFPVRPDGMISLSLIGDMMAAGLTPTDLSTAVATKLQKFLTDPNVTVTVLSVHPKQIFLMGEIAHVGGITLVPGMTPLQAIATGGGLSAYANAKRVYILRTTQGKQQKIPFDYKKAIKDGSSQGITVLPGDTIVIP